MITYTNVRNKDGYIYENKPVQRTISSALEGLLVYEFGYGGRRARGAAELVRSKNRR